MKALHLLILIAGCLLLSPGCKVNVSLNGASIPPDIESCTVDLFSNQAPLVVPSLASTLTEGLKNKIQSNSNISLKSSGGDVEFRGTITGYQVSPLAAQANETAALNRLTVTVSVDYTDNKNDKNNWSQSFSRYADFSSSTDLNAVQGQLIDEISKELDDDIFNKAFLNW